MPHYPAVLAVFIQGNCSASLAQQQFIFFPKFQGVQSDQSSLGPFGKINKIPQTQILKLQERCTRHTCAYQEYQNIYSLTQLYFIFLS